VGDNDAPSPISYSSTVLPYISTPLSGTAATFACDPNPVRRPASTGPRRDEMLRGRSRWKYGHSVIGQDPLDTKFCGVSGYNPTPEHPRSAQSHLSVVLALLHFVGETVKMYAAIV